MKIQKRELLKNLYSIPGWSTKRKIIVFESDDWGSIRTSNINSINKLIAKGIDFTSLDARRYTFNDTLATGKDLQILFDLLSSIKDKHGNSPIFTAVSVVANPDFEAIKSNGFQKYIYEPITTTMKKYHGCEDSFELWQQGIQNKLFKPQYHGREHLNVLTWLHALQNNHEETLDVFNEYMWGYVNSFYNGRSINYQEAYNIHNPIELNFIKEILIDGLKLFQKLFNYKASLFVPPNGAYSRKIESTLSQEGIKYISRGRIQREPIGYGRTKRNIRFLGMKNRWGQLYLMRNCFFEPGSPGKSDWVGGCLKEIETAFRWNKPAIISSHRVNYTGGLNKNNRSKGILELKSLLQKIIKYWPDVEFMTSDELGVIIQDSNRKWTF